MESICDVLIGKDGSISSSSESMNTSLDEWSDDSDEEIDWDQDYEQALVAEAWLQEEFKIIIQWIQETLTMAGPTPYHW